MLFLVRCIYSFILFQYTSETFYEFIKEKLNDIQLEENIIPKEKNIIKKDKNFYSDEKGNPLENKIIDQDELIMKDNRIMNLMKEQEEILQRIKNKKNLENENVDLNGILKSKKDELNELKLQFSKYNKEGILEENEKFISVIFSSEELGFDYSVVCKNTEILNIVFETKLRKEKDGLDYCSDYILSANDEILKSEQSMEKNGIHDGDIIYIIHQ